MKPIKKGEFDKIAFSKAVDKKETAQFVQELNYQIQKTLLRGGSKTMYFEFWGYGDNETLKKGKKLFEQEGWTFVNFNVWFSFTWRVNITMY